MKIAPQAQFGIASATSWDSPMADCGMFFSVKLID